MRRYQTHVTAVVFCWWMAVAACSGCAKTESKIEPISLAVTPTAASVDQQPQLERLRAGAGSRFYQARSFRSGRSAKSRIARTG